MFVVSFEGQHEWHELAKNQLIVEANDLTVRHDLGTVVFDEDGEVLANLDLDKINDPRIAFELGKLAGQRALLDSHASNLNSQQKYQLPITE